MASLRAEWNNAIYKGTVIYVVLLVTIIFGFQMYRYFFQLPAEEAKCHKNHSAVELVPVVGVLFSG